MTAAIFMHGAVSTSTQGGKKPCTLLKAARHNLREIQAELGADSHIDVTKTHLNIILEGPATAAEVDALAAELRTQTDWRPRKNGTQAIEAVFSLPHDTDLDVETYFRSCLAWAKRSYKLPILSAVIHRDEHCPHLHVLMLPVQDGKWLGSKPAQKPALRLLMPSFNKKIAAPNGLKYQAAELAGERKQRAIELVVSHIAASPGKRPNLGQIRALVAKDAQKWMQALGIEDDDLKPANTARKTSIEVCDPETGELLESAQTTIEVLPDELLCSVEVSPQTTVPEAVKPIETLAELWRVVGSKLPRHCIKPKATTPAPSAPTKATAPKPPKSPAHRMPAPLKPPFQRTPPRRLVAPLRMTATAATFEAMSARGHALTFGVTT